MMYRGAQVAPDPFSADVDQLLSHNANIVRYQLTTDRASANAMNEVDYTGWVEARIIYLLNEILWRIPENCKLVLNLHTPPGGYIDNRMALFEDGHWGRPWMYRFWHDMAVRFQNDPRLVFGILNEPGSGSDKVKHLMKECVKRVRLTDKERTISVTCPYSDPAKMMQCVVLADPNIWYETHMYLPFSFSHQGIGKRPYPKFYPTDRLTKQDLIHALSYVQAFSTKFNKPIYVGEFSASAFAPDFARANYLLDLVEMFEQRHWIYTYHAWREAPVWDIEAYPLTRQVIYDAWSSNIG